MQLSMVRLGARIQFHRPLVADELRGEYVGAAWCEDAFAAAVVPRVGELVSVVSLTGGTSAHELLPASSWSGGPFLRVVAVEHYPVAERDGERPAWWRASFTTPGVSVVFHAEAFRGDDAERMVAGLRDRGWEVDQRLLSS